MAKNPSREDKSVAISPSNKSNDMQVVVRLQQNEDDENRSGRWSADEHARFEAAFNEYGKNWKKIQEIVGTRSAPQVRSHAQKYFGKIKKPTISSNKSGVMQIPKYRLLDYNSFVPELFINPNPRNILEVYYCIPGRITYIPPRQNTRQEEPSLDAFTDKLDFDSKLPSDHEYDMADVDVINDQIDRRAIDIMVINTPFQEPHC